MQFPTLLRTYYTHRLSLALALALSHRLNFYAADDEGDDESVEFNRLLYSLSLCVCVRSGPPRTKKSHGSCSLSLTHTHKLLSRSSFSTHPPRPRSSSSQSVTHSPAACAPPPPWMRVGPGAMGGNIYNISLSLYPPLCSSSTVNSPYSSSVLYSI